MLRRFRILSLIAFCAVLILFGCDSSQLDAEVQPCDTVCIAQTKWFLASSLTAQRQWFAAVVHGLPEATCIRHRESRDIPTAVNMSSGASGWYQFLRTTSDNVAAAMGRPDLVGFSAGSWAPWDQDLAWAWLFAREGFGPWGGGCP